MSFTRCLHPPGGAAALTAVLGGPAVASWGMLFPFIPVGLNSCILVAMGLLFHKLSRHNYPHVATQPVNGHLTLDLPAAKRVGFRDEDIDAALAAVNETFDIDRADVGLLLRRVEYEAVARSSGGIKCVDIMSRDVVVVDVNATTEQARLLLLNHNIRTLPVKDPNGYLLGTVGLRELATVAGPLKGLVTPPATASMSDPALSLLPILTDGRTHAVIVVDAQNGIIGLISQTDLLSAVSRSLPKEPLQASAA
jgi:CBS domain-containing membrane protein